MRMMGAGAGSTIGLKNRHLTPPSQIESSFEKIDFRMTRNVDYSSCIKAQFSMGIVNDGSMYAKSSS
ncbi:hypothetical protein Y032_0071g561 [Ancylostoma ceylanicum]|uniref:Uncharacterized protein n=1 Tax=Ancylostoma ceylanicum TaxID=53326 RepID=A0A016TWS6_9BILA|nr:hypothetical protein Y032_0071g561 [Ancylostoma ceylanicum]